jgi:hypothetical protein
MPDSVNDVFIVDVFAVLRKAGHPDERDTLAQ